MHPVTVDGSKIFLNTNMSPDVFAKTRFADKIREKGIFCQLKENKWTYEPWSFEETKEKDGIIFLCGTLPSLENGTWENLLDLIEEKNSRKNLDAAKSLCHCLEGTLDSKIPSQNIGAGGIFFSNNCETFLFMPHNIWTTATMSLGDEEFSRLNGIFINQNSSKFRAIRFFQASLVYNAITGNLPFENKNTEQRTIDIIDGNYRPLKFSKAGVDKKICNFTEKAFEGKFCDFPAEDFTCYEEKQLNQDEIGKFNRNAQKFFERKKSAINSKRFLRARRTIILSAAGAVAVIAVIASSYYRTMMEKPTSKGLTSLETVEMYYTAINNLSVDAARNSSSSALESRVGTVSNVFVTSRTRSMYDTSTETVNPAVWFIKNQTRQNIYGLTKFLIDGTEGSLLVEGPRKNTKPHALEIENDIELCSGDKKNYTVEFYLLDTSGEDLLAVVHQKEFLELTYDRDRWVISSIKTEQEAKEYEFSRFIEDYENCMKKGSTQIEDVLAACESMNNIYDFIPTEHEIKEGYQHLKKVSVFIFED